MRPLSLYIYYRRNKRKVLPIIFILALSIVGVTSTAALADEIFKGQEVLQNFYKSYGTLSLTSATVTQGKQQTDSTTYVEHYLDALPESNYYIRSVVQNVRYVRVLGDNGVPVFYVTPADAITLLHQFDWHLASGRLPRMGTNEIALTDNILKNHHWHVGQLVGQALDANEFLPGTNKIVGVLNSSGSDQQSVTGGIGDLVYEKAQSPGFVWYTYVIRPRDGQEAALDKKVSDFQYNHSSAVAYQSYGTVMAKFADDYSSAKVVLGLLDSVVIVVISIAVALLYIIFLMQRANEFGLLAAIGYGRGFILRKVLLEAIGQVLIGWGLGLVLGQGLYTLFNNWYFYPHGLIGVDVLAPVPFLFSVPVPLVVVVVTTMTICLQLGRLDPVSIIERRD